MNKSYIIGIAGGSASGKSTLAERLASEFSPYNAKLFAMDSYYKPDSTLPLVTTENGKQYRDYNCPASFELGQLKKDIQEANGFFDIIIIEGLLTLWDDEICNLCDLRVFVDCPADIRIVRRIKRNLTWGLSLEDITNVYLDLVRYRHEEFVEPSKAKADVVLNYTDSIERIIQHINLL